MSTIYVFGHQHPDNDSIMASVVLSQLLNAREDENTYVACCLGELPRESAQLLDELGIEHPQLLERIEASDEPQKVILVDHNEASQSIEGLENAQVVAVVDHHRIGGFTQSSPMHFLTLPWGSTCTIIRRLFCSMGIEPTKEQLKCLLSAMMTDTVMLKSPTTTKFDHKITKKISEDLGIDPIAFGMQIFKSRDDHKPTPDEMVSRDVKAFDVADKKILIAQFETVDKAEALEDVDGLRQAMENFRNSQNATAMVLAVTDILEEGSQVLLTGETADVAEALGIADEHDGVWMPGVLSRKKQIAPPILALAE